MLNVRKKFQELKDSSLNLEKIVNVKIGNLWKIILILTMLHSTFRKIYTMKDYGIVLEYGKLVVILLKKNGNIKLE